MFVCCFGCFCCLFAVCLLLAGCMLLLVLVDYFGFCFDCLFCLFCVVLFVCALVCLDCWLAVLTCVCVCVLGCLVLFCCLFCLMFWVLCLLLWLLLCWRDNLLFSGVVLLLRVCCWLGALFYAVCLIVLFITGCERCGWLLVLLCKLLFSCDFCDEYCCCFEFYYLAGCLWVVLLVCCLRFCLVCYLDCLWLSCLLFAFVVRLLVCLCWVAVGVALFSCGALFCDVACVVWFGWDFAWVFVHLLCLFVFWSLRFPAQV